MIWKFGKTEWKKKWEAHNRRVLKDLKFGRKVRKLQDGYWWFAWYPVQVDKHLELRYKKWAWLRMVWVGGGHSQSGWRINYYLKCQR